MTLAPALADSAASSCITLTLTTSWMSLAAASAVLPSPSANSRRRWPELLPALLMPVRMPSWLPELASMLGSPLPTACWMFMLNICSSTSKSGALGPTLTSTLARTAAPSVSVATTVSVVLPSGSSLGPKV